MPASRRSPGGLAKRVTLGALIAAATLTFAACRRNPPEPPRAARAHPEATSDPGAPVLASVLNARAAIATGDTVAAYNDANAALGFAARLAGAESALYPPPLAPPGYHGQAGQGEGGGYGAGRGGGAGHRRRGGAAAVPSAAATPSPAMPVPTASALTGRAGPGGHRARGGHPGPGSPGSGQAASQTSPPPFTSFDAQVRLISALAKLQAHDPAAADIDLQAVEAAVPPQLKPQELPLIRAGQSLALATAAAGRLAELRTQLTAAQAALQTYQGRPHAAEASALAAAIGERMRGPGGLAAVAPAQIALWAGVVGGWTSGGTSIGA